MSTELGATPYLSPATIVTAFALAVVAVALAPLFTSTRIGRIDIASTLRVVE